MSLSLGYVILAHRKLGQLERLIRRIYDVRDHFVVHLDANLKDSAVKAFQAQVADLPKVEVISEVACSWGGYSFTDATFRALDRLLTNEVQYCIVLSGADYPCRPRSELVHFLSQVNGRNFVEIWWSGSVTDVPERFRNRYAAYWPFESLVHSNRTRKCSLSIQRFLGVDRKLPRGLQPVFGSNWMALTANAAHSISALAREPEITQFFRKTALAEEMLPHMLLRHIGVLDETVRGLHYITTDADGTFPKLLQASDLPDIASSSAFFCRKIEQGRSDLLCDSLDEILMQRPAAVN